MPLEQSGIFLTSLYSFLGGILSVLSPCVLPLIPLYMSYVLGATKHSQTDGAVQYKTSSIVLNTCAFVLGISTSFFVLGSAFTFIGQFFSSASKIFTIVGGVLIIIFGFWLLLPESLRGKFGNAEARFSYRWNKQLNVLSAFLMGFFLSFAWSPCVGPILASVFVLSLNAQTAAYGYFEIFVYTLGFVIPFLIIGLGTGKLMNTFNKKRSFVAWTGRIAGILMLLMGFLMASGLLTSLNARLVNVFSSQNNNAAIEQPLQDTSTQNSVDTPSTPHKESAVSADRYFVSKVNAPAPGIRPRAPYFELEDIDGKAYDLSQYEGHVLLINFWATWCGPCKHEIPDLIRIYHDLELNGPKDEKGDSIFKLISITNPRSFSTPGNDVPVDHIREFVKEYKIPYPVLADTTGEVFNNYFIRSFPNTFILDKKGRIRTLLPGGQNYDAFKRVIEDALAEPDDDNLFKTTK